MNTNKKKFVSMMAILLLLIPLWLLNTILYNQVMPILILGALLVIVVIVWGQGQLSKIYLIAASFFILGTVLYYSLPSYTVAESVNTIRKSLPNVKDLENVENTPMNKENFDPFGSKWFYTFRATEEDGTYYTIIFNPDSGEFFKKR